MSPYLESIDICGSLFLAPFFVVINKTPLDALFPYNEVELASFKTEVDSIS